METAQQVTMETAQVTMETKHWNGYLRLEWISQTGR